MGEVRSGTKRSGAQGLPLTRRQQKRARQRQARHPVQQRQTQPPKPLQAPAPEQPVHTKEPVEAPKTSARAAAKTSATPAPSASRPAKGKRIAKGSAASSEASPPPPAAATPTPMKQALRRVKTGAPAQAQRTASAARTLKTAASAASGRKYPTLARMVAVAPRPEPDAATDADVKTAATAEDDAREVRGRSARQDAPLSEVATEAPNDEPALDDAHDSEQVKTQPAPAMSPSPHAPQTSARRPVPTRRLTLVERLAYSQRENAAPRPNDSLARAASASAVRPLPLPEPDLVVPVAALHAGLAAAGALTGAGLLVTGTGYALWPLVLAAIAGAGGWLAYAASGRSLRLAAWLLLVAQLGMLAWLLALLGARGALLALVPALALLALRWLGRVAASSLAVCALALYALAASLQLTGALPVPITLSAGGYVLLDGSIVAVGLLEMLLLASRMQSSRVRAEMAARARQHEVRTLHARLAHLRQQVEDDAARLDDMLGRALAGRHVAGTVETDGLLSPLAETTNAAVERLAILQRDREDRLRLEGAVRTVTRAVERAWLGLAWSWPEWSGTPLDELVALLRAPRPQETPADWSDDTPTLAAIPAVEWGTTPRPWNKPTPISAPMSVVQAAWSQALSANGHEHAQTPTPLPVGAKTPAAQLPWDEWNTWREWAEAHDD